jgi:hypothetical protein
MATGNIHTGSSGNSSSGGSVEDPSAAAPTPAGIGFGPKVAMIKILGLLGQAPAAVDRFLSERTRGGHWPDIWLVTALMRAALYSGNPRLALDLFATLRDFGMFPSASARLLVVEAVRMALHSKGGLAAALPPPVAAAWGRWQATATASDLADGSTPAIIRLPGAGEEEAVDQTLGSADILGAQAASAAAANAGTGATSTAAAAAAAGTFRSSPLDPFLSLLTSGRLGPCDPLVAMGSLECGAQSAPERAGVFAIALQFVLTFADLDPAGLRFRALWRQDIHLSRMRRTLKPAVTHRIVQQSEETFRSTARALTAQAVERKGRLYLAGRDRSSGTAPISVPVAPGANDANTAAGERAAAGTANAAASNGTGVDPSSPDALAAAVDDQVAALVNERAIRLLDLIGDALAWTGARIPALRAMFEKAATGDAATAASSASNGAAGAAAPGASPLEDLVAVRASLDRHLRLAETLIARAETVLEVMEEMAVTPSDEALAKYVAAVIHAGAPQRIHRALKCVAARPVTPETVSAFGQALQSACNEHTAATVYRLVPDLMAFGIRPAPATLAWLVKTATEGWEGSSSISVSATSAAASASRQQQQQGRSSGPSMASTSGGMGATGAARRSSMQSVRSFSTAAAPAFENAATADSSAPPRSRTGFGAARDALRPSRDALVFGMLQSDAGDESAAALSEDGLAEGADFPVLSSGIRPEIGLDTFGVRKTPSASQQQPLDLRRAAYTTPDASSSSAAARVSTSGPAAHRASSTAHTLKQQASQAPKQQHGPAAAASPSLALTPTEQLSVLQEAGLLADLPLAVLLHMARAALRVRAPDDVWAIWICMRQCTLRSPEEKIPAALVWDFIRLYTSEEYAETYVRRIWEMYLVLFPRPLGPLPSAEQIRQLLRTTDLPTLCPIGDESSDRPLPLVTYDVTHDAGAVAPTAALSQFGAQARPVLEQSIVILEDIRSTPAQAAVATRQVLSIAMLLQQELGGFGDVASVPSAAEAPGDQSDGGPTAGTEEDVSPAIAPASAAATPLPAATTFDKAASLRALQQRTVHAKHSRLVPTDAAAVVFGPADLQALLVSSSGCKTFCDRLAILFKKHASIQREEQASYFVDVDFSPVNSVRNQAPASVRDMHDLSDVVFSPQRMAPPAAVPKGYVELARVMLRAAERQTGTERRMLAALHKTLGQVTVHIAVEKQKASAAAAMSSGSPTSGGQSSRSKAYPVVMLPLA